MVTALNREGFDSQVAKSTGRVAVKFWSGRCAPCRQLAPIYEQLSNEISETAFYQINVDEEKEVTADCQVKGIPTVILFENGEILRRQTGLLNKQELRVFLQ
jgi:thioredoxin 1